MPGPELRDLNILVTRPQAQSAWLCNEIHRLAGNPIALPLLDIIPVPLDAQAQQTLTQLSQGDLLIFISANAVEHGIPHLPVLATELQVAAVGEATAKHLREAGIRVDLVPSRFDTEGLLALPELQDLHGKTIVIMRGVGGRETLAETLRARGAEVRCVEVYRRSCPHWNETALHTALRADVITVTSGEALENLVQLAHLSGGDELLTKQLVVFHDRIAGRACELGFTLKPVVTEKPSDEAMLLALRRWANEQKGMEHA